MKKLAFLLAGLFLFSGCTLGEDMMNTPKKKVEEFFTKYQNLDAEVIKDLDRIVAEEEQFNGEQRKEYVNLMKRHYEQIMYEIKDEEIDGDKAVVKVEITVKDYSKALAAAKLYLEQNPNEFLDDNGKYSEKKFVDYRLKKVKDTKDKVKYTLDMNVSKKDDKWKLEQISKNDEQKIHGIYVY